jgi:hypothetical protein
MMDLTLQGNDYNYDKVPSAFNAWLLFRWIVDVILANDFMSYITFGIKFWILPDEFSWSIVIFYIFGLVLMAFALWAKIGNFPFPDSLSFPTIPATFALFLICQMPSVLWVILRGTGVTSSSLLRSLSPLMECLVSVLIPCTQSVRFSFGFACRLSCSRLLLLLRHSSGEPVLHCLLCITVRPPPATRFLGQGREPPHRKDIPHHDRRPQV